MPGPARVPAPSQARGAAGIATAPAGTPRTARSQRAWVVLRWVVGIGLGALALWALDGKRGELNDVARYLEHLRWPWVVVAVAVEAGAIVSFAALQRSVLRAGRLRVPLRPLTAITLAGNSINNSLPGGAAFASVYAFRQYRRRGASDALAAWAVLATATFAGIALGIVAAVGLLIPGSEGSSLDLVGVTLLFLLVSLVVGALVLVVLWRLGVTRAVLAWSLRASQRVCGRPRGDAAALADAGLRRLRTVRPTRRQVTAAIAFALGNWVLDCACLAAAFPAVGAPVPWSGLLLAYGAGQLAANLPITPGGLGVVEGSLTIALVAYGGAEASTVAAVLLYRLVNFWGSLPVGWAAWAALAAGERRQRALPDALPLGEAAA